MYPLASRQANFTNAPFFTGEKAMEFTVPGSKHGWEITRINTRVEYVGSLTSQWTTLEVRFDGILVARVDPGQNTNKIAELNVEEFDIPLQLHPRSNVEIDWGIITQGTLTEMRFSVVLLGNLFDERAK
jgi:hypothetical protein